MEICARPMSLMFSVILNRLYEFCSYFSRTCELEVRADDVQTLWSSSKSQKMFIGIELVSNVRGHNQHLFAIPLNER